MRAVWVIKADPEDVEWIKRPEFRALENDFHGDCDDSATMAAALLLANPEAVRLWSVSYVAIRMPHEQDFSHVWCRAENESFQIDIDPIVPLCDLPVRGYAEQLTLKIH